MPRPHPPEFRAQAIRLARSGERPIRETGDAVMVFRFIDEEKATYPIRVLCRLLGVSVSG
jgi:hypothetical protein